MISPKRPALTVNSELIGLSPVPGSPQRIAAPPPDFSAAHAYGKNAGPAAGHGSSPAALIHSLQDDPAQSPGRLRALYRDIIQGRAVVVADVDLMALQAVALERLQTLFTDAFSTDSALKQEVAAKQAAFGAHLPPEATRAAICAGQSTLDQQQNALNFVLRTFHGRDEGDDALRRAVFGKLGQLGRRSDIGAIMPHLRKGTSSDLFHGLAALHAITEQKGAPHVRGGLSTDAEIGPLLKKAVLAPEERARVIEAVLERGEIVAIKKLEGGGHSNPVYFVTFKETLPEPGGKRAPIEGVFKPEGTYLGKDRAYFSREVAAYQFDRKFARTGLVPTTVEALIQVDGAMYFDLGSLQYKVPRSTPLGGRPPGHKDEMVPANWRDPIHDAFSRTAHFEKRMAQVRTLAYVFNDPDKLGNNVFPVDNLGNILVCELDDGTKDLRMIDNALVAGQSVAPAQDVSDGILPENPDPLLTKALKASDAGAVLETMASFVQDGDARMVADRLGLAAAKLKVGDS